MGFATVRVCSDRGGVISQRTVQIVVILIDVRARQIACRVLWLKLNGFIAIG